uniref:C2H2-type domain-containing protein n=1 Tax=Stomoxys calcitrans TaxID=35570 RepID=A0A1I8PBE5_STOCA
MSIDKACCCLCFTSSYDFKLIQSETGQCNEAYVITVKYFDPMILTDDHTGLLVDLSKVLCINCWSHIKDFHDFQQEVLKTRGVLSTTIDKEFPEIIVEHREDNDYAIEDSFIDKENIEFDSELDDLPLKVLYTKLRKKSPCKTKDKSLRKEKKFSDCPEHNKNVSECDGNAIIEKQTLKIEIDSLANVTTPKIECENQELGMVTSMLSPHDEPDDITSSDIKDSVNMKKARRSRKPKTLAIKTNNLRRCRTKKKNDGSIKQKDPSRTKYMEKCKENDIFIAQWKPNLDCDLCSETATNFNALRSHFRQVHKTKCYIKCCDRKFYRRYVLMGHIRLHIDPETHKCEICGKSSTTKYNLKLHQKIVHGESKQFECDVCHRLFNQKPTLDRRLLTHVMGEKKFFCKECDKGYVLEVQLNTHIKTVHGVDCVCDQCGKKFRGANTLKKHLLEHSGVPKPKFPCDICGAQLTNKNGLRRHISAYHHDGSTAYVCSLCGKVASSENALKSHKKQVHEEKRKFKCTYCDKAFKRPKVLREHIATHTGVDLYQCPHCPQTFKVSANMHHHRKRAHPREWEEARKNRLNLPKVNIKEVTNQVVL